MGIELRKLRDLRLAAPSAPGRPAHLAAASGLVVTGGRFHVVADDEVHLGVFDMDGAAPGRLVRAFPGTLPDEHKPRKKAKPDGEAVVVLPPFAGHAHGALVALGSGSRPNRCRAAVLPLDRDGAIAGEARCLDVSRLYASFAIPKLNIEGACVMGGELQLLHRGGRKGGNRRIRLPLATVLAAMGAGYVPAIEPVEMQDFDLGSLDGVALGFTDAAALPQGRMLFTAVAEDTDDSFHDGPCAACAIGIAAPDASIEFLGLVTPAWKVEGVAAAVEGRTVHLHLVTDADDASRPGVMLAGEVAATW